MVYINDPHPPISLSLISYLAPVSHFPSGTWAEVASLHGVRPLNGSTVGIHLGAALHMAPVGPEPTGGGALLRQGEREAEAEGHLLRHTH